MRNKLKLPSTPGRWQVFGRVIQLMWRHAPGALAFMAVSTVVTGLMPALVTIAWKQLLDGAYFLYNHHHQLVDYSWNVALFVAVLLVQEVTRSAENIFALRIREAIKMSLLTELHKKTTQIPLEYYEDPELFNTVHRASEVIGSGRFTRVIDKIYSIPSTILTLVSTTAVLAVFSPWLVLLALLSVLPAAVARFLRGERFYYLQMLRTPKRRVLDYLWSLLTSRESVREMRLYGFSEYLQGKWQHERDSLQDEEWAFTQRSGIIQAFIDLSRIAAYGIGIALAAVLMVQGDISPGAFGAVIIALQTIQSTFTTFLIDLASLHNNLGRIAQFFVCLDIQTHDNGEHTFLGLTGDITLQNISFSYPGSERLAIDGVNLTIKSGEKVALVGENGAGKTTLVKLIMGMYQPVYGSITYNDIPVASYQPRSLWNKTSAVYQDFTHYQLSMRENIGFGDVNLLTNETALNDVLKEVGLEEVVARLPQGLDSQLGTQFGGTELSGGEWQRVAIARGMLRSDVDLLILDEPTASLDPKTEAEVFRRFLEMSGGKTTIVISHRMGSAKLADRIVLLSKGRVVEEGTHAELMQRSGEYAKLYTLQAQWYA